MEYSEFIYNVKMWLALDLLTCNIRLTYEILHVTKLLISGILTERYD